MRLTIRDGVTSVMAALVVAATFAVTQGWGWPLLGSTQAGIVVLGVMGFAMCMVGTRTEDMGSRRSIREHPSMIVGSLIGVVALILLVGGLIADTEAWLVALAVTLLVLWAFSTVRHAFQHGPATPRADLAPAH